MSSFFTFGEKQNQNNKKKVCKTRRDNGREQKTTPSRISILA
jgi:hypothetical protein